MTAYIPLIVLILLFIFIVKTFFSFPIVKYISFPVAIILFFWILANYFDFNILEYLP